MGTITDAEKVDVRRFLGYPAYGEGNDSFQNWRFFQAYGLLEYRLNHMAEAEETVVRGYLVDLRQLEVDIVGVRENLDTAAAAVWTRNPNEQGDRERLYRSRRMALCYFLGVPAGDALAGGMNVRLVV